MNILRKPLSFFIFMSMLFAISSCQANGTGGDITVNFQNNQCTFDGPLTFNPQKQAIRAIAENSDITYLLFAVTLEEGRTIEDLRSMDLSFHPPWLKKVNYLSAVMRGQLERLPIELTRGSFYLFCASSATNEVIGVFGPIEIQ